jgi:ATP-dependent Lon protease
LGDLTIQGNFKVLPSITEILQMALENGALRALLPTGNKIQFSSLPEEVVEKMDILFFHPKWERLYLTSTTTTVHKE